VRVLFLVDSLAGGGAESVVANLVNYLAQNKSDMTCHVVTLYHTDKKYLSGKNFPFHCLNLGTKYSLKGIGRLTSYLSTSQYDIVHTHLFPANYYAAITSLRFPRIRWIHTEHSVWNRRRQFPIVRKLEATVYSRFDITIAVSHLVAVSLKQWLPSIQAKVRVIPNGVSIPEVQRYSIDLPSAEHAILFVGRLERVKGIDILLKAFASLSLPAILLLAGDGSQRSELEELALALGISDRIKFLGFQADVQQLMASVDCVVLPSRWEGLPMVALEAMALGVPVVAAEVGGLAEVIEHLVTGWLVPPEDPQALARTLREVLFNKRQSCYVGQNARQRIIESYSVEVMVQKTLNVYSEVLNQPRYQRRGLERWHT
jgi:glycosyltransferase involved in cell wall biosynthesis